MAVSVQIEIKLSILNCNFSNFLKKLLWKLNQTTKTFKLARIKNINSYFQEISKNIVKATGKVRIKDEINLFKKLFSKFLE